MQLAPSRGFPGVLHACSGLQGLHLRGCTLQDPAEAAAAVAALPGLQRLCLEDWSLARSAAQALALLAELQLPVTLTYLNLNISAVTAEEALWASQQDKLTQLSGLVNLQHLTLATLPDPGLPGGLPSQLVKLTYLNLNYLCQDDHDCAQQFQHLSSLTALHLVVDCFSLPIADLQGIQCLSQLTGLELASDALHFSTTSPTGATSSITSSSRAISITNSSGASSTSLPACLTTALQRLDLNLCSVQPEAVAGLTSLRSLSLLGIDRMGDAAAMRGCLPAVSRLALLTRLRVVSLDEDPRQHAPAAPFTALTASSNLCSLQLGLQPYDVPIDWQLCDPGVMYPKLRAMDLAHEWRHSVAPLAERHLQQLCSCCPAVDDLRFAVCGDSTATALQPLLRLTTLTALHLYSVGTTAVADAAAEAHTTVEAADAAAEAAAIAAAAAAAVVAVAAQLTGLKELGLQGLYDVADPTLLQLTALTALEQLVLEQDDFLGRTFKNKARWSSPPDVWKQLRDHLAASA